MGIIKDVPIPDRLRITAGVPDHSRSVFLMRPFDGVPGGPAIARGREWLKCVDGALSSGIPYLQIL